MNRSIVLLRGLSRGTEHWLDFPALLQATFTQDKIFCIDLAGNGYRVNEQSPNNLQSALLDLKKQLQLIPAPYYVIGLSLGAMLWLNAIENNTIEIKKAVLINPSHAMNSATQRIKPLSLMRLLLSLLLSRDYQEKTIYKLTSQNHNHRQKKNVIQYWLSIQRHYPFRLHNLWRQLCLAKDCNINLTSSHPEQQLIIASIKDQLVNPACSAQIAQALNSPICYHQRAGHDIALDDANWLIHQCRYFFDDITDNLASTRQTIKPTIDC